MGAVAGLVIGGISLAALFDSCMNAFDYIETARNYGKEYQKCAVKISLLQLRLARWEESISAISNQASAVSIGTAQDAETVKDLLGEIATGIEDTQVVAKRYKLKDAPPVTAEENSEAVNMTALVLRAKNLSLRRQQHSSIGQKTRWALHDQRKFTRLIDDLTHYISQLEALFPAERFPVLAETQQRIAESEVTDLVQRSGNKESEENESTILSILEALAPDIDATLQVALYKTNVDARRHGFGLINVKGNARIAVGDYVGKGDLPLLSGHDYGILYADGNTRVLYGNNYGGKRVFDD